MKTVENAIISTDLAMYFKKKDSFKKLVDEGEFGWKSEGKKEREFHCSLFFLTCLVMLFHLQDNRELNTAVWL
jgi:cGMP-specific 3',5'-cyclic phosphodiesterase